MSTGTKYWELIADSLHRKGWSWGSVGFWNRAGQRMHCVDASKDGKRFIVHADDILTDFLEIETAIAQHQRGIAERSL